MTVAEILRAAREKIADPKNWTQGVNARDALGDPVPPSDFDATCWCSYGAVAAVELDDALGTEACNFLHDAVREISGRWGVAAFNDDAEHSDVLAMFNRAVEIAEGRS